MGAWGEGAPPILLATAQPPPPLQKTSRTRKMKTPGVYLNDYTETTLPDECLARAVNELAARVDELEEQLSSISRSLDSHGDS